MINPTQLWGLPLSPMTRRETGEEIVRLIEARQPCFFITANTNYAMLTAERPELREVTNQAAFVVADGAPMIWASRRGPVPLPERVAGSDLIYDLARLSADRGYRVYFLHRRNRLVILLAGGDMPSQARDIRLALELASYL